MQLSRQDCIAEAMMCLFLLRGQDLPSLLLCSHQVVVWKLFYTDVGSASRKVAQ